MTAQLPLFPLSSALFPGVDLPLQVFEPRYRALVAALLDLPADDIRQFGIVQLRSGHEAGQTPPRSALGDFGTAAVITTVRQLPDGRYSLHTRGHRRFRLHTIGLSPGGYLVGEIDWLTDEPDQPSSMTTTTLHGLFTRYVETVAQLTGDLTGAHALAQTPMPSTADELVALVAGVALMDYSQRQDFLALPSTAARTRAEIVWLRREIRLVNELRAVPATPGLLRGLLAAESER
jgi:Lon protease-like protein